jgi:hypothetical protein
MTIHLLYLVDEIFNRHSALPWVRIFFLFSKICSLKQTSCMGFSRRTWKNQPGLLISRSPILYISCHFNKQFKVCWLLHQHHCIRNKEYYWYSYICLIHWPTSRNRQWGSTKNKTWRQTNDFCFSWWIFQSCSNILVAPAYEVSQSMQYSRASSASYQDFPHRELLLTRNLLNKSCLVVKSKSYT